MKHFIAVVLISSLGLAACREQSSSVPQNNELAFSYLDSLYAEPPVYTPAGDTIQAKVQVHLVQVQGNTEAAKNINEFINTEARRIVSGYISDTLLSANPASKLEEMIRAFLADAAAVRKEADGPTYMSEWEMQLDADTIYLSPQHLSVQISYMAYTGGAHPNNGIAVYSFNRQTGEPIDLVNAASDTVALRKTIVTAFYKNEEEMAKTNQMPFEKDGYFFEKELIPWPSMAFVREGVRCVYSPYEVAPYVRGPIEFILPENEWKNLEKK